jgi:hypothetical protein
MRTFYAIASITLLGLSAIAWQDAEAQRRGRDQVCVYEHADFRGWEQCFDPGDAVRDLSDRRNKISSVRVRDGGQITLYEMPQFGGRDVTIDRDVSDLRSLPGWNDQADSVRVGGGGGGGWRDGPGRDNDDRGARVCVYEHVNYQGKSQCFRDGDDESDLTRIGWNDGISSIRVSGRSRVMVFEHTEYGGDREFIDRDVSDLTQIGWNDRISSLRTGEGGRRGRR